MPDSAMDIALGFMPPRNQMLSRVTCASSAAAYNAGVH
jgi:hypothetical protein